MLLRESAQSTTYFELSRPTMKQLLCLGAPEFVVTPLGRFGLWPFCMLTNRDLAELLTSGVFVVCSQSLNSLDGQDSDTDAPDDNDDDDVADMSRSKPNETDAKTSTEVFPPPGLPSPAIARNVSSELFGFCFSLVFPYFLHLHAVRKTKLAISSAFERTYIHNRIVLISFYRATRMQHACIARCMLWHCVRLYVCPPVCHEQVFYRHS